MAKYLHVLFLFSLYSSTSSSILATKQPGKWPTLSGEPTLLNAHRGETVLVPENTLESTALAAILLSDYIELDLTLSADGQLMVYHDLTLRGGSNIASLPQFADRVRNFTGVIEENGPVQSVRNNWMFNDLTVEELQSLKVIQRGVGIRPRLFDGLLKIPTFSEFLSTVHHMAYGLNRSVGLVVEIKNPYYYNTYQNHSSNPRFMENLVLATLAQFGYPLTSQDPQTCRSDQDNNAPVPCGPIIIQSFELPSMVHLHQVAPFIEKSMLIGRQLPLLTYQGMTALAGWISYYSPWKELLYTGILAQIEAEGIEYDEEEIDEMGGFVPPQDIVPLFHSLGVKVFIYTVYDSRENSRRGCTVQCDPQDKEVELFYYFDMGVDGIFAENMMETRETRMKYQYERIGIPTR